MRRITRLVVAVCTAPLLLSPVPPAMAVSGAEDPEPQRKKSGDSDSGKKGGDKEKKEKPRGELEVCIEEGLGFGVYAEGPSLRRNHLLDDCSEWKPVLPGRYEIGFDRRIKEDGEEILIDVYINRNGREFFQQLPEGCREESPKPVTGSCTVRTNVTKDGKTVVKLFIKRPS